MSLARVARRESTTSAVLLSPPARLASRDAGREEEAPVRGDRSVVLVDAGLENCQRLLDFQRCLGFWIIVEESLDAGPLKIEVFEHNHVLSVKKLLVTKPTLAD